MGILDKLKSKAIEATNRPRAPRRNADPVGARRIKFAAYLAQQKALMQGDQGTAKKKGKKPKTHFWLRSERDYVFAPKYGSQTVVVFAGKPHFSAKSLEELQGVVDELIAATNAGELDQALTAAAERKIKTPKAAKAA